MRTDPETGFNVRELDFLNAFRNFVESALKIQPDIVIHSGDLFNSTRPTNRAIAFALEMIKKIVDANIKFVVICGNHSTPRLRETGNIFRVLEKAGFSEGFYPVYGEKAETICIENTAIHALPHIIEERKFQAELANLKPLKEYQYNVLALHAAVTGIKEFRMGDINELIINTHALVEKNYDYVALGHYHRCTEIFKNVYYAGATERMKFDECSDEKGFLEIDLENKKVKMHIIPTRPMIDLPPVDCKNLTPFNIMREIVSVLESTDIKDKIIRLNLINLTKELNKTIDYVRISNLTKDALHVIKNRLFVEEEQEILHRKFGPLTTEYLTYIDTMKLEGFDKEWLKKEGIRLLTERLESG